MRKQIRSIVRKALKKQPPQTTKPAPPKIARKTVHLDRSMLCRILDLPVSEENNPTYTMMDFAEGVQKGGVAVVWDVTSTSDYRTGPKRCERLADSAMQKGAALLISNRQIKDYPCLVVDGNPFDAYSKIIAAIRAQFHPMTVGVTGSIGKTTTYGMILAMLEHKYRTYGTHSNLNSARYAARQIQQLSPEDEAYVQEIAEGPPFGAASAISKFVMPQAAVVTVIGTSHMESFGSQERILESCLGVQDGMPEDGLLVLNGDDPFQQQAQALCRRKVVYYGIENEHADYRAVNIRAEDDALVFDVAHDGVKTPVRIRCFGRHNVSNALAAFAIGKWAGMTDEEVAEGLYKFETTGIRQNLIRYGGYRLYLDCYNAAAESMASSFDVLRTIPVRKNGRRIAVLADIMETGEKNREIHEQVGVLAAQSQMDLLICFGESAKITAEAARAAAAFPVLHTADGDELERMLRENITENDVVLFKGSRKMALEQYVDRVYGTWFYESDDDYFAASHPASDDNFRYRVFADHAIVTSRITAARDVIVPETFEDVSVTGLDQFAFNRHSQNLTSVRLPQTLRSIRYGAFYKNADLTQVEIPGSVQIIETTAFSQCRNLQTVVIRDGCTHIGNYAFYNCENLKTIEIPASVHQIEPKTFLNCKKMKILGVPGSYAEQYAAEHGIRFRAI